MAGDVKEFGLSVEITGLETDQYDVLKGIDEGLRKEQRFWMDHLASHAYSATASKDCAVCVEREQKATEAHKKYVEEHPEEFCPTCGQSLAGDDWLDD
jgi:hypothetical protein